MEPITIIAALVAFPAGLVCVRAYRILPRSRRCPTCRHPTVRYRPRGWPAILSRRVHWRWCAHCGRKGLRRSRPAPGAVEGADLGHRSGFRWGAPDPGSAPVFRWKPTDRNARGRDASASREA